MLTHKQIIEALESRRLPEGLKLSETFGGYITLLNCSSSESIDKAYQQNKEKVKSWLNEILLELSLRAHGESSTTMYIGRVLTKFPKELLLEVMTQENTKKIREFPSSCRLIDNFINSTLNSSSARQIGGARREAQSEQDNSVPQQNMLATAWNNFLKKFSKNTNSVENSNDTELSQPHESQSIKNK